MLNDKKRKRQKEEESPKKKAKLCESPSLGGGGKAFKAKKKFKNAPSLNLGAKLPPSNQKQKEKKKKFKNMSSLNVKGDDTNLSPAKPTAGENFSKLFADLNSNKSKKKFKATSPLTANKTIKQETKSIEPSADVNIVSKKKKKKAKRNKSSGGKTFPIKHEENPVEPTPVTLNDSKKKKKKAKSPMGKEQGGPKLSPKKHAVEENLLTFSDNEESTEFVKKNKKRKIQSSEETDGEKKGFNSGKPDKKEKFQDKNIDRTLFVGNLPADINRKGLEKIFANFGNVVESVRLRGAIPTTVKIPKKVAEIKHKFHENLHSRKGFVVFKTSVNAKAALALNGTYVQGHHIIVDKAVQSGEKKSYDDSRSVFVGNLPFDVEDEQIWSAFSVCGKVEAVRVIRDPETGAGKGFGYVLFTDKSGKQAALNQDKLQVEGRNVRIKPVEGNKRTSKNNSSNFARRQAMKTKKAVNGSQGHKSSKKLMKKHQAEKQKKNIAQAFKNLL